MWRTVLTRRRIVVAALFGVYAVVLLRSVLLPMPIILGAARDALPPWTVFVQLLPLVDVPEDPSGMILNVGLFVPFGLLVPLVLRRPSLLGVGLTAAATSLAIELIQLTADLTISTGRIADIDDLLGNTAGALVGYAGFVLLRRIVRTRQRIGVYAGPERSGSAASSRR